MKASLGGDLLFSQNFHFIHCSSCALTSGMCSFRLNCGFACLTSRRDRDTHKISSSAMRKTRNRFHYCSYECKR